MKNKSKEIDAKKLLGGMLALLMFIGGIVKAYAEELAGIVIDKRDAGIDREVLVRVNQGRPFDHILRIMDTSNTSSRGGGLDIMIEKGSVIIFDDEGLALSNGIKNVDQRRIISVNGISVLDMFPGQEEYFRYAAAARQRGN